jgi:hypothetical protein
MNSKLAVALIALAAAFPASAQVPYDLNCNPVTLTENQRTNEETCAMHAACRFLVQAPLNSSCKFINYVRNLGKSDPAFDNSTLIDGVTYDPPGNSKFDKFMFELKAKVHSALGTAQKRDMVLTDDGKVAYYERGHTDMGSSTGAIVYSDGTAARGSFDDKYRLNGPGQLITPDGKMRAGEFMDNRLAGEGFVTEKDGNRTVLVEGTFDGDTPVGEVIRNFADGSRQRELWENGKLVARGDRAPKGQVPPPIKRPEPKPATPPGDEGYFLVEGVDGRKQWEFRCRGRETLAFGWYAKGETALKPAGHTCKIEPQPVQAAASVPATSEDPNPLIVQGPPWPCEPEIEAYIGAVARRGGGADVVSAAGYWQGMRYSRVQAIFYGSPRGTIQMYQQYTANNPNVLWGSVVFNYQGVPLLEGYFRNRAAMNQLAGMFQQIRTYDSPGSETQTLAAIAECAARYLEANAKD